MRNRILLSYVSAMAILTGGFAVHAETITTQQTVTTKTHVQAQDLPDVNQINFSAFDVNRDGIYSMAEVGERLFESFDQDHNGFIDNLEWDRKTVMTITPMERETFRFVDEGSDGTTDSATYTYETFYQASGLMRFDENHDGLSAAEFIGEGFQPLDDDEDNLINLEEWKEAYLESRPEHNQPERYN